MFWSFLFWQQKVVLLLYSLVTCDRNTFHLTAKQRLLIISFSPVDSPVCNYNELPVYCNNNLPAFPPTHLNLVIRLFINTPSKIIHLPVGIPPTPHHHHHHHHPTPSFHWGSELRIQAFEMLSPLQHNKPIRICSTVVAACRWSWPEIVAVYLLAVLHAGRGVWFPSVVRHIGSPVCQQQNYLHFHAFRRILPHSSFKTRWQKIKFESFGECLQVF